MSGKSKAKHRQKRGQRAISLVNAKEYLVRNDLTAIAEEIGVTRRTVSNVLHGRTVNWTVAEKIIELAEKNKSLKERAESI